MPLLYRQRFKFGPYRLNTSRSGVSHSFKVGPVSWNSRTRRIRFDMPGPFSWQSRARYGFLGSVIRVLVFGTLVFGTLGVGGWYLIGGDPMGALLRLIGN